MYGSKNYKSRRSLKLQDWFKSYDDYKDVFCPWLIRAVGQLWIMGESAGDGLWVLALVTGGRWHLTCDTWNVTCDMSPVTCDSWHMTHDFCLTKSGKKVPEKPLQGPKMAKKSPKVQKRGFHSIAATIRTRQDSCCLLYAVFFWSEFEWRL